MTDRINCTVVCRSGEDCDQPVADEAPMSLCLHHLIEAYVHIRDRVESTDFVGSASFIRLDHRPHVVYYILFGDRVKIGTTSDLKSRLINLPHDQVLAVEPGGVPLERQRQNEWADAHVTGEWFHATPELLAHAWRIRQQHPDLVPA